MSIYERAIKKWGEMQLVKANEELAELQQAISKRLQGKIDEKHNFEEEIADVKIMIAQLELMSDKRLIDEFIKLKLERLEKLIEEK